MDVLEAISSPKRDSRSEVTQRLSEVLNIYLRYHRIEGSTQATLKFYGKELGLFLRWLDSQGCKQIGEVTRLQILECLSDMKDRGLAPRSVRTRWQAITTWLKWCVAWEFIEVSPGTQIKAPKVPKIRKPFLSKEQFQALLDLCPLNTLLGARRQSMMWLMASSGIRRREMSLLELVDIDWDRESIRVIHGKGQKERQIPFDRQCQRVMFRYLQQRNDSLGCLWVTQEGIRLTYDGIGQDIRRLMQRAGIEVKDCCHIFRRTRAAILVREGVPRPYICETMGWSPTSPMLDLYVAAMAAEDGAIEAVRDIPAYGR